MSGTRNIPITIRVTAQEKEQITENANAFGGSVSEFIRHQSLFPDEGSANDAKMQAIARELCRLCKLIKNPDTIQLRRNIEDWSGEICQYMK